MAAAAAEAIGGRWQDLRGQPLNAVVLRFLTEELKFAKMAPVQANAIPLLLHHHDVVVEAITGSGKTLAYLVPAFEMLLRPSTLQACADNSCNVTAAIVLPSRELAQQVFAICQRFLTFANRELKTKLAGCCFIGGRAIDVDLRIAEERGANIIVGTPGRLVELLVDSKKCDRFFLGNLELVILDEADKLLDLGFHSQLDSLLRRFPKQRRTGLFSATQTRELSELARAGMRNPVVIRVRAETAAAAPGGESKPQVPDRLSNYFAVSAIDAKLDRLLEFLAERHEEKILIYAMTCASVDWLHEALAKVLLPSRPVFALHGQQPLKVRQKAAAAVNATPKCVLLCTDVAARGLDIPNVGTVVQFDAPVDPNTFVHRIGRTARMGKAGTSLVLLAPAELEYVPFMKLQNVQLMPLDVTRDDPTQKFPAIDRRRTLAATSDEGGEKKGKQAGKKRERERELRLPDAADVAVAAAGKRREEVCGDMCTSPNILALRRAARVNPQLLEKAVKAFVSFIRAYKEHECRYIFQLRRLDITALVHAFGLFKVPNCGEIRRMATLRIPIQDEFKDVLEGLDAKRLQRREEADRARAVEAEAAALDADETRRERDAKRHRTERNQRLEAIRKDGTLSRSERSRAWKQAELDELRRESFYLKKERQGRMPSRMVDAIVGEDAQENAVLSTRERLEAKKSRRHLHQKS